jgi:flagellar hook-associated protein 1 FlgK
MDLVNVMMNAGAGLGVFRAQVATASHNIANANTPGYARQDAVATETIPAEEIGINGYLGRGVTLQGVVQTRDQFVEAQISSAFANSSSSRPSRPSIHNSKAESPTRWGSSTRHCAT